jgi:hypothetical protein
MESVLPEWRDLNVSAQFHENYNDREFTCARGAGPVTLAVFCDYSRFAVFCDYSPISDAPRNRMAVTSSKSAIAGVVGSQARMPLSVQVASPRLSQPSVRDDLLMTA